MRKPYLFALLFILILSPQLHAQKPAHDIIDDLWYKNSVIYNLEVGTFKDSNGDGIGDFEGVIQELDYLKALGVDAIWLAPFQPSPGLDDGYDVADYYGVNPKYGTSGDFAEFMYQAKKRGIRVIMDLVLNHTSDQHPWFQSARSDKNSPYRDWYVWSKERPDDWNEGMVFPGVQKETWSLDKKAGEYYYHRFYKFQPDLNYERDAVRKEAQKILGYWINQGVSGFRLDAVPFIIESPKTGQKDPPHDFDLLSEMRRFVQWRKGDALILGEANVLPNETKDYFGEKGDGMHMMFNFHLNQHLFVTLASGDSQPLINALQATKDIPAMAQWAIFLRNHDEVDLGRLSDQQQQMVFQRFGPEKNMQIYERGIRRRLAPMIGNRKQLELAYSIMFSLPGAPVVRYGDEIGMGDDLKLQERISVRTPMQWTAEKNAGFTTAEKPFRPVIDQGEYSYQKLNVADQHRDPASFLNWTTKIIQLRKECPEIGMGDWEILATGSPHVLAMRYTYQDKSVVMVHNFAPETQQIKVEMKDEKDKAWYDLLNKQQDLKPQMNTFSFQLEGYGYKWYRVNSPM